MLTSKLTDIEFFQVRAFRVVHHTLYNLNNVGICNGVQCETLTGEVIAHQSARKLTVAGNKRIIECFQKLVVLVISPPLQSHQCHCVCEHNNFNGQEHTLRT